MKCKDCYYCITGQGTVCQKSWSTVSKDQTACDDFIDGERRARKSVRADELIDLMRGQRGWECRGGMTQRRKGLTTRYKSW